MQVTPRADRHSARARSYLAACALAISTLSACSNNGGSNAIETAQVAVRANPALELLATDERQQVLTVKVVRSGQVMTVSAADVIAGTAFRNIDTAAAPAAAAPAAAASAPAAPAAQAAAPAARPAGSTAGDTRTNGNALQVNGSEGGASKSATVGGSAGTQQITASNGLKSGVITRSADGSIRVEKTVQQPPAAAAAPPASAPAPAAQAPERRETAPAAQAAPSAGANIDESRLQRRSQKVECVGSGNVDLTNVLLVIEGGPAVSSSGSCHIRIRDSHVRGAVAVQMAGFGSVTIENSIIEGPVALQFSGNVEASVKSSTVRGQVQRVGGSLRDLGGNLWR